MSEKIIKDCRQDWLSAAQVAKLCGISPGRVLRACNNGELEYKHQNEIDFKDTMRFGRRPTYLIERSKAYEYRAKINRWRKRVTCRKA